MAPLICLIIVTSLSEVIRLLCDWNYFSNLSDSLRIGLACMFIMTGLAHFNKMQVDLIRMVPTWVPYPKFVILSTGVIEILGALALLFPPISAIVAAGFVLFLVALFPANVQAAKAQMTIGGRKALGIAPRGLIQIVFIGACLVVAAGMFNGQ